MVYDMKNKKGYSMSAITAVMLTGSMLTPVGVNAMAFDEKADAISITNDKNIDDTHTDDVTTESEIVVTQEVPSVSAKSVLSNVRTTNVATPLADGEQVPSDNITTTVVMKSIAEDADANNLPGTITLNITDDNASDVWKEYSNGNFTVFSKSKAKLAISDVKPADDLVFLGVQKEVPNQSMMFISSADLKETDTFTIEDNMILTVVFGKKGQVYEPSSSTTKTWTVSFDKQDNTAIVKQEVEDGAAIKFDIPTKFGYKFLGWFENKDSDNKDGATQNDQPVTSAVATKDITYYARWQKLADISTPVVGQSVLVHFDTQGGSVISDQLVVKGEKVLLPNTVRDGYTFLGWYDKADGGTKIENLTASSDITLYAHWQSEEKKSATRTYLIAFDFQTGSIMGKQYAEGEKVEFPGDPSYDNKKFIGWFDAKEGGNKITELTATKDMTLYAQYEMSNDAKTEYTLTFDTQGGSKVEAVKGYAGSKVALPEAPTKDGYTFLGWYDAKENGNKLTSVVLSQDMTLYAHWQKNTTTFTVKFTDGKDGKAFTDVVYAVKEGEATPSFEGTPELDGYEFAGWSPELSDTVTESVTYTAQWKELTDNQAVSDNAKVSQDGKSDTTAEKVKTADTGVIGFLGAGSMSLASLLSIFGWKKQH